LAFGSWLLASGILGTVWDALDWRRKKGAAWKSRALFYLAIVSTLPLISYAERRVGALTVAR
jgi:hypothetical protein